MSVASGKAQLLDSAFPHLETTPIHIKEILAATDLSGPATLALKVGARLARQLQSRFHVLYTVMPQIYAADTTFLSAELQKIETQRAEKQLHLHLTRIPEVRTIRHEEIALCGPPAEMIGAVIEEKGIDLVVMGSHGRGGLSKMVLGSVAEEVLRRGHRPALIVGPRCTRRPRPFRSIVLAVNLPVGSLRAVQYAMSLAQEAAALTIVHVMSHVATRKETAGSEEHALRELRQLVPSDPDLAAKVRFEVTAGSPAAEIVSVARRAKASLIVMGAREHSVMAEHAPWATLSEVIRESRCPVLAVQPHIA